MAWEKDMLATQKSDSTQALALEKNTAQQTKLPTDLKAVLAPSVKRVAHQGHPSSHFSTENDPHAHCEFRKGAPLHLQLLLRPFDV